MTDEMTSKTGDSGGILPEQLDLMDVGPRRRAFYKNEYSSMTDAMRTNLEKLVERIPSTSPLARAADTQMEHLIEALDIGDDFIMRTMVRRFVMIGLALEYWEERFLDGDIEGSQMNNHFLTAVNTYAKLGAWLKVGQLAPGDLPKELPTAAKLMMEKQRREQADG